MITVIINFNRNYNKKVHSFNFDLNLKKIKKLFTYCSNTSFYRIPNTLFTMMFTILISHMTGYADVNPIMSSRLELGIQRYAKLKLIQKHINTLRKHKPFSKLKVVIEAD